MSTSVGPAGLTISRTITRLPGSTVPANTACCSVGPVRAPEASRRYWFSIRSVEPISVVGSAGLVRTLMRIRSSRSPSMMSLPARPVNESLPAPPSRMSPSPQTGPTSGHRPEAEIAATAVEVPSH